MLNPKVVCALAVFVAGCSGRTEMGGEGVPDKQPSSPATPAAAESPKHLMMVVEVEPDLHKLTPLDSRNVDLPLPKRRIPVKGPWRAEVLGNDGTVLYAVEMPDGSQVRSEGVGPDGQLQGVHVRKPKTAVTLRLPLLAHAASIRLVDTSALQSGGAAVEIGRFAYPSVTP